jgi:hypothetical protein
MTTIANKYFHTLSAYGIDQAIREGKAWYPFAWKICLDASKQYQVTPERVAALLAVTSPRARWERNIEATRMILEDARKPDYQHRSSYGILGASVAKGMLVANDRYYSRHVTGPKVSNFYLNILGWQEPVTVDSIMSKAAGYGSDVNNRIRTEVTDAVNTLSEVIGLSPRDTQAAVWIAYRGTPA